MDGFSRRKLIQLLAMSGASSLLPFGRESEATPVPTEAEATSSSATQTNHPMKRIALEEHFVINKPAHLERWVTLIPDAPRAALDKLHPLLTDVGEQRLEAMSAAGIDLAVLSNVGVVQGVLDPTPALQLTQEGNDFLARPSASTPRATRVLPACRCKTRRRVPTSWSGRCASSASRAS